MPATYSPDLRSRVIKRYCDDGLTMREVAEEVDVSLGFVCKIVKIYNTYGTVVDPTSVRSGRPPLIGDVFLPYLRSLLEANSSWYLDEIQTRLYDVCGVQASLATISRTLRGLDLTLKGVSKEALERNNELRILWEINMAQYTDPDLFLFLDESAVDSRTPQRISGWSPRGSPCVKRSTFLRGQRYSILPALSSNGIVALDIFEGSVTKERFLTFLREQVVRHCILHCLAHANISFRHPNSTLSP
jgi:transposase